MLASKPSIAHCFYAFRARIPAFNWHPIEAIFCSKYPVVKNDDTVLWLGRCELNNTVLNSFVITNLNVKRFQFKNFCSHSKFLLLFFALKIVRFFFVFGFCLKLFTS